MNDDIKIIEAISDSLAALLVGGKSDPVIIPEGCADNKIKILTGRVNEIITGLNSYTESLLSISNGELAHEIPKGKMKIHGALKNLQANLNHLTWTTKRIAAGDFSHQVDFMGDFSNAFNSMTMQLKQAFEIIESQNIKLLKRDREITRDLKLAAVVQKALISDKPDIPGIKIHSIYKPMILIGGDFFTFVKFRNEERFGVFIADVNGHGVSAALVTGILAVLINSSGELKSEPAEFLHDINSRIVDLGLDIYFTALYGICDVKNKTFTYARGGHNRPFWIQQNHEISELNADGPMLGVMKDISIETQTVPFSSGDKLIIYTDGLTETENNDGIAFETQTLRDTLDKNADMNIQDYINSIYEKLIEFRGSDKFNDDVCILGIELLC